MDDVSNLEAILLTLNYYLGFVSELFIFKLDIDFGPI